MNAAALILSLTELIITYNALKFEFEMEGGGPPLVRTKNPRPQPGGERRPISMKLRVELGDNVQLINCFRWLLNFMGVDFKLPNSGALPDVGVEWLIVEGGGLDWASRYQRKQEGSDEVVQWTAGFRPNQKTDAQGTSRVTIEGTAQRRYLTGKVLPVMKSATVRTNIQLKPADIFRDTGDALRGPWVVLAELIYRTRWFSSDFTFPVKDWEPCDGGWYGTIKFSGSKSISDGGKTGRGEVGSKASRESSWSSQQTTSYEATIQVHGEEMRDRSSYQKARIEATASYYSKSEKSVSEDNYCGEGRSSRDTATSTFIKEGQATDSGDVLGNIDLEGNKFRIIFSPPKRVIEGLIKVTSRSTGGPCGTDLGSSRDMTEQMRFEHVIDSITGTIDPRDPDFLKGSKVVETTRYGPVTITWDLTRCGRSSP